MAEHEGLIQGHSCACINRHAPIARGRTDIGIEDEPDKRDRLSYFTGLSARAVHAIRAPRTFTFRSFYFYNICIETEEEVKTWKLYTCLREEAEWLPYLFAIRIGQVPCVKDEVDGWLVPENTVQGAPSIGKAGFRYKAVQRSGKHVLSNQAQVFGLGARHDAKAPARRYCWFCLGTTSTMNVRPRKGTTWRVHKKKERGSWQGLNSKCTRHPTRGFRFTQHDMPIEQMLILRRG